MAKKTIEFFLTPAPIPDVAPNANSENQRYRVTIRPDDPITVCEIHAGRSDDHLIFGLGKLAAYGLGVRKLGDVYDLETGCRMALKSAIKNMPREFRAQAWEKYLILFPISKRVKPESKKLKLFRRCVNTAIRELEMDHRMDAARYFITTP